MAGYRGMESRDPVLYGRSMVVVPLTSTTCPTRKFSGFFGGARRDRRNGPLIVVCNQQYKGEDFEIMVDAINQNKCNLCVVFVLVSHSVFFHTRQRQGASLVLS
jgi:hypothetical protein